MRLMCKIKSVPVLLLLLLLLLLFDSHISEKISKAYMMLGIIKKNSLVLQIIA